MSMKFAKLLYNQGAGDAEHSGDDLIRIIESAGYDCSYNPDKKVKHQKIKPDKLDFVILAGGDGTVRKVAEQLIHENLPIGLLPMGTANNIAKTLGIRGEADDIIKAWSPKKTRSFDVGYISGIEDVTLFLESFGYGVFPVLMDEMKKQDKDSIEDPKLRLRSAVELLHDIVETYEGFNCTIKVDGADYSGKFLLVEIMNIRSIGPNLNIAPMADPGDGCFEIVMIPENKREEFAAYIETKINDNEQPTFFNTIRANSMKISCDCKHVHVDDQKIKLSDTKDIYINMQAGALTFLAAGQADD